MNRPAQPFEVIVATVLAAGAIAACDGTAEEPAPPAPSASAPLAASNPAQRNQQDEQALNQIMRLKVELANLSIEQIWTRVAGDRPMPEDLRGTIERMTEGTTPPPKLSLLVGPGPIPPPKLNLMPGPGPRPPPKLELELLGGPGTKPPPKLDE